MLQSKPKRGVRRPPQPFQRRHQEKDKGPAVDADGFQQVKNRKNTRRNIFDEIHDEMRVFAKDQQEVARQQGQWKSNVLGEFTRHVCLYTRA